MDSSKPNVGNELIQYTSGLRSGNLLKAFKSMRLQSSKKYDALCIKYRQSAELVDSQAADLEENYKIIEKLNEQCVELSSQCNEFSKCLQAVTEENTQLNDKLEYSESVFAQLDIAYEHQLSALFKKNNALEVQMAELQTMQNNKINQFDKAQTELQEKLNTAQQINKDLTAELETIIDEQNEERKRFQSEIDKTNEINETLRQTIRNNEENIRDQRKQLEEALVENKQISVLKDEIQQLKDDFMEDQNNYRQEKTQLIKVNEDLKTSVEDLKTKILSKEKEIENIYIKFKELANSQKSPTPTASRIGARKRSSSDAPRVLSSTSDSDNSSVSFYKFPKRAPPIVRGFSNHFDALRMRPPNTGGGRNLEIPETPMVSSSANDNEFSGRRRS